MILVAIGIGTILILLRYLITSPYKYWKDKGVPYPPVSYLFGNVGDVVLMKKSLRQVYDELYNAYPDLPYIGFYKARTPCILIRDSELVKEVTAKNFNSFRDNDVYVDEKDDPLFSKNPFSSKGQMWKERRNQNAPSFTAKRVKDMYPIMETVAGRLVDFINTNIVGIPGGIDAKELCLKYTTDVVANCALGLEANSFADSNSEYIKMLKKVVSPSFINNIKFMFIFVFPSLAKLLKVKVVPDDAALYYETLVTKTLDYRTKQNIHRGDFLDGMNEIKKKLGSSIFTDLDITAHTLTFFTDGIETSGIALTFTLYELGSNLHVQANLKTEIEEVIVKYKGVLSYDAIQDMEYLDQVINENLRKNTPFTLMSRVCTEQTIFESPLTKGKRVVIDTGTPIIIPVHSIHHDSRYYPDPSVYDPTRFSKANMEKQTKYTFLPFGEGPRICLGQRFGTTLAKVAVINILQNFEIRINKATTVPYKIDPQYIMLSPVGGIRLDFLNNSKE